MAIIDKPSDYFNTKLYTGTGSSLAVTGVGFQPDLNWTKDRGATENHTLTDAVRGATKRLFSNTTGAESINVSSLTSFDSDGFTVAGAGTNGGNNQNYVSWNWKAGTSVSGTTTGSGTAKTYSGSVNTDAGFSIITYVGNNSAGMTVPHHLGAVPKMIIVKNRDEGTESWQVYHGSLGATKYLNLNLSNAVGTNSNRWNNTEPTSSVFTNGVNGATNENNSDHIAYCFAEKQGYSKFGSYIGNGNDDGTFIYLGFKPAWTMIKRTNSADNWVIDDATRSPFNLMENTLYANLSNAEYTSNLYGIDFLSNGFKIRDNDGNYNGSGSTYIYMAFAENPFVTSTGVPATAR